MNTEITTFEQMSVFADMNIRLAELKNLQAFMFCPFTLQPFEISFNINDQKCIIKILQGQIVFRLSELQNLNITCYPV
jgi:hypothetical protein